MQQLEQTVLTNADKVRELIKMVTPSPSNVNLSCDSSVKASHTKNWDKGWNKYGK